MEQDWNARGDLAENERLRDWLESQSSVLGFWMDRLTAKGDDQLVSRLETHLEQLDSLIGNLNLRQI